MTHIELFEQLKAEYPGEKITVCQQLKNFERSFVIAYIGEIYAVQRDGEETLEPMIARLKSAIPTPEAKLAAMRAAAIKAREEAEKAEAEAQRLENELVGPPTVQNPAR